ncbi:MAG: NAD(P)-binding domain-containing protein [Bacteroidales bacterium]|nr:NAD(P)-binding domain-containing protein [Bacteroidales bacterium]
MATQVFAVTGNPILHSKSPNMFNAQFKHNGLDANYIYLAAETADEAIFLFRELNVTGMNVTSPFKETIGSLLDVVHDEALILGSVNTIVNKNGELHGYNTDFYGVTQSFIDAGISLKGKRCVVLGAGGAGKAAAYGLQSQGAQVVIVNRTEEKGRAAAEIIGCKYASIESLQTVVSECDIVISALRQNVNPIQESWLNENIIVFDANYKGSPLVEMAKRKNCMIVSAEDWLLNQAVASYKLFLGASPDKAVMKSGLTMPTLADRDHVVSTIGIMGAGKTTHGKLLAEAMHFKFKDIDDEIVAKEHCSIPQIFSKKGVEYFRKVERETLSEIVAADKPCVISCGGGIVLHEQNRNILKQNSLVVWFYATPQTIINRISIDKRPLLQCDNPLEKLQELLASRMDNYVHTAHVVFSTEIHSKSHVTERLKDEIERIWNKK